MYILNTKKGCAYGTTKISYFEDDNLIESVWVDDCNLPKDFIKKPDKYEYVNEHFILRDTTTEDLEKIKNDRKAQFETITDPLFMQLIEDNFDSLPVDLKNILQTWIDKKNEIRLHLLG